MEEHLIKIDHLADNLVVLSRGLSDVYPEAEGAVLAIGENIKREVQEAMDHLYDDKSQD